jgi:glycosyltransferase involved in cell wall biosynthesis
VAGQDLAAGSKRGEVSKLSVIIPTLNEERHAGSLLSDVAAQTRKPDEVLVVDAGSTDGTIPVVRRFPFAKVLEGEPPVACGRNLDGRSATGEILIFLDADIRLPETFFEGFHTLLNALFKAFQGVLPSGARHCIAVRGEVLRGSRGFDPGLKFDDIELIRRLSRGRRLGIVEEQVFVGRTARCA